MSSSRWSSEAAARAEGNGDGYVDHDPARRAALRRVNEPIDGAALDRQAACVPTRYALLSALALLVWASDCRASDEVVAPQAYEDHGFIEPCTIANYQEMFTECELCQPGVADPNSCNQRFGRHGYLKKCRTRDTGHGFGEVWCIEKARTQPAAHASQPISLFVGMAVVLVLLAMYLLSRRDPAKRRPTG